MSLIIYLKYLYFFKTFARKNLSGNKKRLPIGRRIIIFHICMIASKADDRSLLSYSAKDQTFRALSDSSNDTNIQSAGGIFIGRIVHLSDSAVEYPFTVGEQQQDDTNDKGDGTINCPLALTGHHASTDHVDAL
jgi:hypothetical protein